MVDGVGRGATVVVVGCGNMGGAILAAASAALRDATFLGVDPDTARSVSLLPADLRATLHPALPAGCRPDCVVLAVKPQVLPATVEALRDRIGGALVISIAAGITAATLRSLLPEGARVVRAMSNLPAMVGAAMTVGFAPDLPDADRGLCEELFAAVGRFAWVGREDLVDAATAVSGSGPGYVFAFAEHLAKAGEALGLPPDTAAALARQTLIGAGRLLESDRREAAELKRAVTSPGGTTEAGLAVLEAPGGLPERLPATVRAAFDRAVELSRG